MYSETSTAVVFNQSQNNLEFLRTEVVHKRLVTLTYLRNVFEGKAHWFGTVYVARQDLERSMPNSAMKKRTPRLAVLGMSLASVLEIQNGHDLLRGVMAILNEYDQFQEDNYKPKMKNPFRSSKMPKRLGPNDFPIPEMIDASLFTPNIPFGLDYHQVLLSLVDVMSEVYYKVSLLLGRSQSSTTPNPNPMSPVASNMLSNVTPQPGVSYLFTHEHLTLELEALQSIAGLTSSSNKPAGSSKIQLGAPGSPTAQWTPLLGELLLKMDGKIKKILSPILKEIDDLARACIKDELASLDPLLRNLSLPGPADYEMQLAGRDLGEYGDV